MELIKYDITKNPSYQANVRAQDSRYTLFQSRGPAGLMLHSVGCAQPSAEVFAKRWNSPDYQVSVHAFIDANSGAVWQLLPWNYRAWHCGGSGNDTHVGVEMCESAHIRYTGANKFQILDREKALADCRRAYQTAVELFARLCARYGLDPAKDILSHKEGHSRGLASDHGDPEHYWSGLGAGFTMAGFRADVAAALRKERPVQPAPETQTEELPFPDVAPGDWYAEALRWAVARGVIHPGGPFRPDAPCTRAAAVVLLRRLWQAMTKPE